MAVRWRKIRYYLCPTVVVASFPVEMKLPKRIVLSKGEVDVQSGFEKD